MVTWGNHSAYFSGLLGNLYFIVIDNLINGDAVLDLTKIRQ